MKNLNNIYFFTVIFFLCALGVSAQSISKTSIDLFLSDSIIDKTNMKDVPFINSVCVTKNRYILLSSKDSLYFVGYGGYRTYKPIAKNITAFCISDSSIYCVEKNRIFQINSRKGETLLMKLSFTPFNMWGGENLIYASSIEKGENLLYVIYPKTKKVKRLLHLENKIVSVVEYNTNIYVFTSNELIIVNSKNSSYITIPLPQTIIKGISSAVIDKNRGGIFFSCIDGLYRFYNQELHKLYSDNGILCYDEDGLILFNASQHFLVRLRNNMIYPQPKDIIIEIK